MNAGLSNPESSAGLTMAMERRARGAKNASNHFVMPTSALRPSRIRPFVPLFIIALFVSMPIFTQPAHARGSSSTATAAFVPSSRSRSHGQKGLRVLPNSSNRNIGGPSSLQQQQQSQSSSSTRQQAQQHRRRQPKHLVLIGGGHAHVQVIKALRQRPDSLNWRVTLVDAQTSASYSGMVPGCVAGLYAPDQTQLHLPPLAERSSIEFVHGRVVDMDLERQLIYLQPTNSSNSNSDEGQQATTPIHYDAVSLDIGSTARGLDAVPGARQFTIPTRPIDQLVRRLEGALQQQQQMQQQQQKQQSSQEPVQLVVVGGGAAGLELALSVTSRWRRELGGDAANVVDCTILDAGTELLPGENERARATLRAVLRERGIRVRHQCHVTAIQENVIELRQGNGQSSSSSTSTTIPYTHCLWAAGAAPHRLAHRLKEQRGLDCDERGWIRVAPTLQSTSHPSVFAAGDCATLTGLPGDQPSPPKAGVYAVRAGPVLIENLTKYLASLDGDDDEEKLEEDHSVSDSSSDDDEEDDDEPTTSNSQQQTAQNDDEYKLTEYAPQDDFLKLLACGDGTALGFRFGLALRGKWVFQLKDDIDQSFMKLFDVSNLSSKEQPAPPQSSSSSSSANDSGNNKRWYETPQYDDADDSAARLPAPRQAADLLQRTDDDVDYRVAKLILRTMGRDDSYRKAVLDYCHQDEAAHAAVVA